MTEQQGEYKVNKGLKNATVATTPAMIEPENQRAIAEVQASIMLAKKFPRNVQEAYDRIMISCQRPGLAEAAIYSYAKGGTAITGPSIRLAEVAAQNWGNVQFGIRELDQRSGESTMEAYAWDLETNVRQTKVFQVKHIRYKKAGGSYALDDPREIYEMTANQGARRLRSCILGIIPGDIIEAAVDECERTMKAKADTGPEGVKRMLAQFEPLGVIKEQIEKRIQRRIDTITAGQMVGLRKVFNSLRDGMSQISDWFELAEQPEQKKTGIEGAKEALKQGTTKSTKAQASPPREARTVESDGPPEGQVEDPRPDTVGGCYTEKISCRNNGALISRDWCEGKCPDRFTCEAWKE